MLELCDIVEENKKSIKRVLDIVHRGLSSTQAYVQIAQFGKTDIRQMREEFEWNLDRQFVQCRSKGFECRREERIEEFSVIEALFVIDNTVFFNISETSNGTRNACNVLPDSPSHPSLSLLIQIMGVKKRIDVVPRILAPTSMGLRSRSNTPRLHLEAADMFCHFPSAVFPRRALSK
jgi:hypothetical protein